MNAIRPAAVAGSFYPANPGDLKVLLDQLLADANTDERCPKAIIAPHAGYVYSGPIAASAYARLFNREQPIKKVVLMGPSHRVAFKGIAVSSSDFYRTPLGDIPVDTDAIQKIINLPSVGYLDEAHSEEHSLEVQLPFLQTILPEFELIPFVVGDASAIEVSQVLAQLWGGEETLIVISSDLSHYHSYVEAQVMDQTTSKKIQCLDMDLTGDEACGCRPLNGLMHYAKQTGYKIEEIDLRNSGDTSGSTDRVVGYGAYIMSPMIMSKSDKSTLPLSHRQILMNMARNSINNLLSAKERLQINLGDFPSPLREDRASFVTLNLNGQLRGCIGSLIPHRPLIVDVAENAQSAASKDPRFKPLSLSEYLEIDIHLSVLSVPEEISFTDKEHLLELIRPEIDGLIIEESGQHATYLPSVWKQLPDQNDFVRELRRKAGLDADSWSTNTRIYRYTTEEFF